MGVHGTFCQLCGLPTQHDHYVPTRSGMLKIYRGSSPHGGHAWESDEHPFRFGPEHEWLKDAVVLPWDEERVLRGAIEDGALEDVMVFEGGDDGLAFHHACWELQGSPGSTGPAVRANGFYGWALVDGYHEQLFDLEGLQHDGKAWMLADPRQDARSRARIQALYELARHEVSEPAPDVAGMIRDDRDWASLHVRGRGEGRRAIVRARNYTIEKADKTGFGALVRVTHSYEERPLPGTERMVQLEAFESALKAAVEAEREAIFAVAAVGKGLAEYLCWARDGARTRQRIEALPGARGARVEVTADPAWQQAYATLESHRA